MKKTILFGIVALLMMFTPVFAVELTVKDCMQYLTNGSLPHGFYNVTGTNYVGSDDGLRYQQFAQSCDSSGCEISLVDDDGYVCKLSENFYETSTRYNITQWMELDDHSITVQFNWFNDTFDDDYIGNITIISDNGATSGIHREIVADYSDISDYLLGNSDYMFMEGLTRLRVTGYGTHSLWTFTTCNENDSYVYDGTDYSYSFCKSVVDATPTASSTNYGFVLSYPDYINETQLFGKEIIVNIQAQYSDAFDFPLGYYYATIGDTVCSDYESAYPSDWNFSPDCRLGGETGYAVAVGTQQMQLLMVIAGVVLIIGGIGSLVTIGVSVNSLLMSVFVVAFGIAIILFSLSAMIVP
ncbi:MAG: hypothetical protein AM325_016375 [Candidatus Thorarchaeota archaeon SMTZ1-45]